MLDFIGADLYPPADGGAAHPLMLLDTYRAFKPGQPGWILETSTAPGMPFRNDLAFYMWLFIAHGFDNIVYFHWRSHLGGYEKIHNTFLPPSGKPAERYQELVRTVRAVKEFSSVFSELPPPDCPAAIVSDCEALWGSNAGFWKEWVNFEDTVRQTRMALFQLGAAADIIPAGRDLQRYRLVIIPRQNHFTRSFADELKNYLRNGGTVLLMGDSGRYDGNAKQLPATGPEHLEEAFGIAIEDGCRVADDAAEAPALDAEPHEYAVGDR